MASNVKRGDIYWADLRPVEGSEQGGTRPVFVISNNLMNKFASVVSVIPMTRGHEKTKRTIFNVPFAIADANLDLESIKKLTDSGHHFSIKQDGLFLCNQSRTISKNRLLGKIGRFNEDTYKTYLYRIENALIDTFALNACSDCEVPLGPEAMFCKACSKVYRIKCIGCGKINSLEDNFCSNCGGKVLKSE
ncbi:type II toxin-antitoxin system PemK/MazF family toxin [Bacillus cereus]|uniref:type II toxin-antitoxin system PemK/MazF family toxin n=1 Tax=Bacillus sp. N447-1 TaxID=2789208 RepID=UPI001F611249|nr:MULTISPECIES: type II toxin-antitoxin system PemK/MazF family toxin [Bacillus]MDF9523216.1 type II toxin-antitoxin system PemK/MazF family toxin [Bacillus cereus]MDF9561912.1 type II toxin-antitoxin system PemK/MazF family toxin [Bacillus cereus]UNT68385.1 type II toxin-antitoxin system PemK/MazF family toxin [Bacillus sp. N447-1]